MCIACDDSRLTLDEFREKIISGEFRYDGLTELCGLIVEHLDVTGQGSQLYYQARNLLSAERQLVNSMQRYNLLGKKDD